MPSRPCVPPTTRPAPCARSAWTSTRYSTPEPRHVASLSESVTFPTFGCAKYRLHNFLVSFPYGGLRTRVVSARFSFYALWTESSVMPLDQRRIAFSQHEVLAAIQQFYMRTNRPSPLGSIENASVGMVDAQCAYSCDVVRRGYREQVRLAGEALAA